MNYEDRVTKEYIEDALAGAGPKIVTGTYEGDGVAARTISLGFTPKAVLLCSRMGMKNGERISGGFVIPGMKLYSSDKSSIALEIVNGGFRVGEVYSSNIETNISGVIYAYAVLK